MRDVPGRWRLYLRSEGGLKMSKTIELDIPASAEIRARRSVILNILEALTEHDMTKIEAVNALDDLVRASIAQATGRTRAGNDIGGI
jgi:hypothetical protein